MQPKAKGLGWFFFFLRKKNLHDCVCQLNYLWPDSCLLRKSGSVLPQPLTSGIGKDGAAPSKLRKGLKASPCQQL